MEDICAIGRIRPDGPWIGFQPAPAGYLVIAGQDAATRSRQADPDVLLALAIAYFEEAFEEPPQELEASHEDLSALVRRLAEEDADPGRRRLLAEAIDAIDDGLAGDAVANRLSALKTDEQADPIDLLVTLVEELLRD